MTRTSKARNSHNPGQNNEQHATIARYNWAIKLHPSDDKAYCNRGVAYYNIQNFSRALADFDQALQLNPDDDYAWYKKGLSSCTR